MLTQFLQYYKKYVWFKFFLVRFYTFSDSRGINIIALYFFLFFVAFYILFTIKGKKELMKMKLVLMEKLLNWTNSRVNNFEG